MKIVYIEKKFKADKMDMIRQSNAIIVEYEQQGYDLTLRQIYYQIVARDLFPEDRRWRWTGRKWVRDVNGTKNAKPNYKWLGEVINDGRLAGLISWEAIVDRTRSLDTPPAWDDPRDILRVAYQGYGTDLWIDQDYRVEVWVEKDALSGVVNSICRRLNVPDFACRGYTSQSEMWSAGNRLLGHYRNGQMPIIIHMGDHDPSGIDMSRDIVERLELFMGLREGDGFEFIRAALNMSQIEQYNPPPFFAKLTDSRANGYIGKYGTDSWELDALDPTTLDGVITGIVGQYLDDKKFEVQKAKQENERAELKRISQHYYEINGWLDEQEEDE